MHPKFFQPIETPKPATLTDLFVERKCAELQALYLRRDSAAYTGLDALPAVGSYWCAHTGVVYEVNAHVLDCDPGNELVPVMRVLLETATGELSVHDAQEFQDMYIDISTESRVAHVLRFTEATELAFEGQREFDRKAQAFNILNNHEPGPFYVVNTALTSKFAIKGTVTFEVNSNLEHDTATPIVVHDSWVPVDVAGIAAVATLAESTQFRHALQTGLLTYITAEEATAVLETEEAAAELKRLENPLNIVNPARTIQATLDRLGEMFDNGESHDIQILVDGKPFPLDESKPVKPFVSHSAIRPALDDSIMLDAKTAMPTDAPITLLRGCTTSFVHVDEKADWDDEQDDGDVDLAAEEREERKAIIAKWCERFKGCLDKHPAYDEAREVRVISMEAAIEEHMLGLSDDDFDALCELCGEVYTGMIDEQEIKTEQQISTDYAPYLNSQRPSYPGEYNWFVGQARDSLATLKMDKPKDDAVAQLAKDVASKEWVDQQ